MKTPTRLIQTVTLLGLLLTGLSSLACTTDAWNGGVTGTPVPGSPTPEGVPRVSGLCGMGLDVPGSVKDTSPAQETDAFIRFYVLADLASGSHVIFEGFSDDEATASLFTVTFDGVSFTFDAGAGTSDPFPGRSGWNMIELYWAGSTNSMDFWINNFWITTDPLDPPTGSVTAVAGTMESVVLGTADTVDGTLTFDDYESHRDTPVGGLVLGDANNDGDVNIFDISATVLEIDFFSPVLQEGTPDCNMDGEVNIFDISAMVLAIDFFSPIPCSSD